MEEEGPPLAEGKTSPANETAAKIIVPPVRQVNSDLKNPFNYLRFVILASQVCLYCFNTGCKFARHTVQLLSSAMSIAGVESVLLSLLEAQCCRRKEVLSES